MPFASRVFDKVDVLRFEGDLFSSRNFNLSSATECDHVLAMWATMPIGNRIERTPMQDVKTAMALAMRRIVPCSSNRE
jgi:hypothetical protein